MRSSRPIIKALALALRHFSAEIALTKNSLRVFTFLACTFVDWSWKHLVRPSASIWVYNQNDSGLDHFRLLALVIFRSLVARFMYVVAHPSELNWEPAWRNYYSGVPHFYLLELVPPSRKLHSAILSTGRRLLPLIALAIKLLNSGLSRKPNSAISPLPSPTGRNASR